MILYEEEGVQVKDRSTDRGAALEVTAAASQDDRGPTLFIGEVERLCEALDDWLAERGVA